MNDRFHIRVGAVALALAWLALLAPVAGWAAEPRLRLLIETDAGGDPDDEQSLVRFLLYVNEWDVEGIIANQAVARDGENRNTARTGLGIVRRQLDAYGVCWTNLQSNDERYPTRDFLWRRTVPGDNNTQEAVDLIMSTVDKPDVRPLWYSDWGTDHGAATNNLQRALERVMRERGTEGYARFKSRLRLASADAFGPHTTNISPPFAIWVNTFQPERDRRRWYHRFSALTSRAGGFDLERDVLKDHGPLGALYPTNTTHWAKEGDTMTFLYLIPNGLNVPEEPTWGGWGGRYGPREALPGKPYYWANQTDYWNGQTNRDAVLARWAVALQNDFRARLDWCVKSRAQANHPPEVRLEGSNRLTNFPGDTILLTAAGTTDPDSNSLAFHWESYPEAGTYRGPLTLEGADTASVKFTAPLVEAPETLHLVLTVTDDGVPPLSRYQRVVVRVDPVKRPLMLDADFRPPAGLGDVGGYRSPLQWENGEVVRAAADWPRRRAGIKRYWDEAMGPWPPLVERPRLEILRSEARENFIQHRVRVEWARGQMGDGWLLVPGGQGPFPAMLVPFYEPETSIGKGTSKLRAFALHLTRRGFVTLSIGSPGGDARRPESGNALWQPLSFLAYVAANCHTALAQRPEVDPGRIGVIGHSYGGKWALFAAALHDKFACCVASDPGIVWDEKRPNVNYWEPWYLGQDAQTTTRRPGLISTENPRTGAYRALVEAGHDLQELHALLAPRPFLVSGGAEDPPERWRALNHLVAVNGLLGFSNRVALTSRPKHEPTPKSNEQMYEFVERFLKGGGAGGF